jgi:hypothetical protein
MMDVVKRLGRKAAIEDEISDNSSTFSTASVTSMDPDCLSTCSGILSYHSDEQEN